MTIRASIIAALTKNIKPGLVLQVFALAILLVYFFVPASEPVFAWFGELKQRYGFTYSFVATAIFGGLIPFLYLWLGGFIANDQSKLLLCIFYLVFWGLKGMEVDYFYRLQADWFGTGNDLQTIITKMAVDQFLYSALWSAPGIAIIYTWMESGWSITRTIALMDKKFFSIKIPTMVLSNWLVWIPAVCVVYAMPVELQIPLFNLVLCFWVLLVAILNRR